MGNNIQKLARDLAATERLCGENSDAAREIRRKIESEMCHDRRPIWDNREQAYSRI